jgi:hypothetical protein
MNGGSRNAWRPSFVSATLSSATLLLLVCSLYAAPRKPPSSLQKPGAIVRFSHLHERIAGCKFHAVNGERVCAEQTRVPAAAGIDFTLTPQPAQLVSEPSAPRNPVNVSLPNRQGTGTLELRVESGNWLLSWADQHTPFNVDPQRNFSVRLSTLSGACVEEGELCSLRDDVTARTVTIPPERQGTR